MQSSFSPLENFPQNPNVGKVQIPSQDVPDPSDLIQLIFYSLGSQVLNNSGAHSINQQRLMEHLFYQVLCWGAGDKKKDDRDFISALEKLTAYLGKQFGAKLLW